MRCRLFKVSFSYYSFISVITLTIALIIIKFVLLKRLMIMTNERPLILITNDDGVFAKGINTLIEIARPFGDVVIFAPDTVQSGMSNAITAHNPIFFSKLFAGEGYTIYSVTGTPTDCIKLACHTLFKNRKPDLLLSGINHGSNSSINVFYSGTMGAVFEGCANRISSVGFSLCDHSWDADFSHAVPYIKSIIEKVLKEPLPNNTCLNVNIPAGEIKGVKICRQANGCWKEEFKSKKDKNGLTEYWLTGEFCNEEPLSEDTDDWALAHHYISIVPCNINISDTQYIKDLKDKDFSI
jgi:5'-nucleotidase